jgi:hypothetical protein
MVKILATGTPSSGIYRRRFAVTKDRLAVTYPGGGDPSALPQGDMRWRRPLPQAPHQAGRGRQFAVAHLPRTQMQIVQDNNKDGSGGDPSVAKDAPSG